MENPQVNARLSPELNVEFNRWVDELGVTRSKLAWNIVTEALAARREGRATFSRPEQPSPVDLQHLTAKIATMVTELDRVLRQNGKREAELARRRVGAILLSLWVTSVVVFFVIAMVLPRSWLAVRSANTLLGGGDQAVCALVDYRMATDRCRVEIDGQAMKVVVKAEPRSKARRP